MPRKLWVEAYRPTTLSQVILSPARRAKFEEIIRTRDLPNMILTGPAGTGKTSTAGALLADLSLDPGDVLRVNCSDEKIDAMREKVQAFAYTMPLGDLKVVRLEEIDGLSQDAQKLLRQTIEEVSGTCRFVATANYINRVLPAIRSRLIEVRLDAPNREDVLVRGAEILEAEGVAFDLADLERVVAAAWPDVRKTVELLSDLTVGGRLTSGAQAEGVADWRLNALPLLEAGDLAGARRLVCAEATKEELESVYKFLYDNLDRVPRLRAKADEAVVLIAQYAQQHVSLADPELGIAALFIELNALAR